MDRVDEPHITEGKPDRMQQVAKIISTTSEQKIVVLSALSGTTNTLVEIGELLYKGKIQQAEQVIEKLKQHYQAFINEMYSQELSRNKAVQQVDHHFNFIRSLLKMNFDEKLNKDLLAQGELMSTKMFQVYLEQENIPAMLIPALDFMQIDENQEPDVSFIREKLNIVLQQNNSIRYFITQGYICKNHKGETDNLKRGGSDFTATLIGAAINSKEVQIWTDISGMHNNDPRIVDNTFPIAELSFNEAAELAYFGAKILHPSSIWPVQQYNVPVRLLNTMDPTAQGTYISEDETVEDVKAIAAKDGIIAIKIKSSRMLLAYGFLRKVFEIFEKYKTPIDMITTSEVAVSLTIDDATHLEDIIDELDDYGTVNVDRDQTIICIVGNLVVQSKGIIRKIFQSLDSIPVRMISYGGSKYNISVLVESRYKDEVLKNLNKSLFE